MATLPQWTKTLDDDFVNTWYEIRAAVIDNVLDATVLTAALKNFGTFDTQVGSKIVTDTVGYGEKTTQRFGRGTVLTQQVIPLDTMARWDWRYFQSDINRSLVDDSENAGTFKIKDYVARRLEAARNAIVQDLEKYLTKWGNAYDAPKQIRGLFDICPAATAETAAVAPFDDTENNSDSKASGTSNGELNRTNPWWKNWTMADAATASSVAQDILFNAGPTNEPYALNIVPDMRHMFNKVRAQQDAPNFILMDSDIYEAYEDEAQDKQSIVQSSFTKKAVDLGFDAFTYKGATMSYSSKLSGTKMVFMLNLNHVKMMYNPNVWFDLTDWMNTPNQHERVAYIVCMSTGLITNQPRRHGVMEYAS